MITLPKLLGGIAPHIRLSGSSVRVLESPSQFSDTLLELSSGVSRRARISSLYFGDGPTERQIGENLVSAVRSRGCDVEVVMDACRGLRTGAPALSRLRDVAPVYLFRPPHGQAVHRFWMPGRLGEILRVHHMKYYIFDDTVLLSGANLAGLYFGPRQDRYVTFHSPALADYLCAVHELYCRSATQWGGIHTRATWSKEALGAASQTAKTFSSCNFMREKLQRTEGDTSVFPLFQIHYFHMRQIDEALHLILQRARGEEVTIASGYFNPSKKQAQSLSQTSTRIILPSSRSNGFHGGRGVKACIPHLYNAAALRCAQKNPQMKILQYEREGWTFHGKGLWHRNTTILGSSNFNRRAERRDFELSFAIVTENESLKDSLEDERERLLFYSSPLKKEHRPFTFIGLPLMSSFL